jgi:hypothetical protein
MVKADGQDGVLWAFLGAELRLLESEARLPAPPAVPVFARLTVRPAKAARS